ncbi:TPR-like protein [Rhizoctonia solani]|uniref:TPR-like protein n=1 Tax=Rhizoctonia solani TaxID=456999 RepID=A0A8H7H3J5_9AGAM|nr:TPR-like protein [Rhizoctonia solani]
MDHLEQEAERATRALSELSYDHADLESRMEYVSRALAFIPETHRDLPRWLCTLVYSHLGRFKSLNKIGDLENAIKYLLRAFQLTPDGSPYTAKRLCDLGELYQYRFRQLGEPIDLERAMDYTTRAVNLTPIGHQDLPSRLSNLGTIYGDRFRHQGELSDSDEAIKRCYSAVAVAPDDHPDLPRWLDRLGVSYGDRFKRLNEIEDLDKSIKYMHRAINLTPINHQDRAQRLGNLCISYRSRFQRLGKVPDNDSAIAYGTTALSLLPNGHPDVPQWLADLGASCIERFRQLGELEDLNKAIDFLSRAAHSTPEKHPELPNILNILGEAHGDRFIKEKEFSDLGEAIVHARRALELTPEGHPTLPTKHSLVAKLCFLQYETTGSELFLESTLNSFRMACKSSSGSPSVRFEAARNWAALATGCDALRCLEAYQTAMDLLPQYIWLGATNNQRYEDLKAAVNLAVDAASTATYYSKYALALEWIEYGRCVVWTQSLMLRSPLDELHSFHPELAIRLRGVAKQLNDASSESRESLALASGSLTAEEVGLEHRRLALEYEKLLLAVRRLPGFTNFLQPKQAAALVNAAQYGPIVVINCHTEGSDALIILPGKSDVQHIPFPDFTEESAIRAHSQISPSVNGLRDGGFRRAIYEEHDDRFGEALHTVWIQIVRPVLDYLGYMDRVSTEALPHITWCPTGMATFLPLHAAGDYDTPRSRVFDYVISSYSPILSTLLSPNTRTLTRNIRLLAVGQTQTPGFSSLPGVGLELAAVRSRVENQIQYTQLTNDQATPMIALETMDEHDWVHFACHASQDFTDPTKSGFYLHQDMLTLSAINRQSFKNKGLAYLAACQTATGDENLPDEAIHLASGMLMAGYPSVIATRWSVRDDDAVVVANTVYAELMKCGKIGGGEAGKALHKAVDELRQKIGEKEYHRWVPYIHIGS